MIDCEVRIGDHLEELGWRQGIIVKEEDVKNFFDEQAGEKIILIVASQSCDIANNNLGDDPYIELSVSRVTEQHNGNLTFNKNPRKLHLELLFRTEDSEISESVFVELLAFEKLAIEKKHLKELIPDSDRLLDNKQLEGYISWLASRYSRPALPTTFNKLISQADPKSKRKKKAKSIDNILSGIYVEINPDRELSDGEFYSVNLLGLVAADYTGELGKVETVMSGYVDIMKKAGMDVNMVILSEDKVSIAMIRRFKRFYFDDLSIKNDTALPPEIKIII